VKSDVQEYIKNKRSSFSQETKSILDYSVFDFNHVPDKSLIRTSGTKDYLVGWDAGFFVSDEGVNNPLGLCSNERLVRDVIEIEN